jgi:hypothetical protein
MVEFSSADCACKLAAIAAASVVLRGEASSSLVVSVVVSMAASMAVSVAVSVAAAVAASAAAVLAVSSPSPVALKAALVLSSYSVW